MHDFTPSTTVGRRTFLGQAAAVALAVHGSAAVRALAADESSGGKPILIGSRRELFVDDYLIASLKGAEVKLHKPEARDVALVCDAPWEGNTSAYFTLLQDGDRYRAYYRGSHFDEATKKASHPEMVCYAESRDGIKFEKPKLGLVEFNGSKENNIVRDGEGSHNFTPFKDDNPACSADARYKALAGGTTMLDGKKKSCLRAYKSPDGVRWSLMSEDAVLTAGAFDSQNLAFFDAERGEYRAYWRIFSNKVRAIRMATSKDFLHWDHQTDLTYVDSPDEHLYTNAITPYFRAPHLFVGFPTRFQPKTQQVEPVFMSSRDGVRFHRFSEALIPITAPQDRDGNRSNYMARGLLQLPGNDRELSVYATEAYYTGPGSRVRRFAYRMDGFASASAGPAGGTLLTKPLVFTGSKLSLNIASRGATRVEVQDAAGKPLPGFAASDCQPITADAIEHSVTWKGGSLASIASQPVRLHIELQDADLYSLRFTA